MTRTRFGATSTDPDPGSDEGKSRSRAERVRERMVERQLRRRGVSDERVLEAMRTVPRELFVPPSVRWRAYQDGALRIGEGQTISQPWIVATMTELLELRGEERVLEVGTGSGYAAAVLAHCAREVVSIERYESLAARARAVLQEIGARNVEVRVGDGSAGAPDRAPFGGISVTATAHDALPQPLLDQIAPGGAIVCPIRSAEGEYLVRVRDGVQERIAPVRFVPLVEAEAQSEPRAEPHGSNETEESDPT